MMNWQNKRVVILGLARQGVALTRYLAAQGARVVASDMNVSLDTADLRGLAEFVLGEHPLSLLDGCDVLCLSGGVPIDLPIVLAAKQRGIPLSNDAQIFFEACPAPIIGITGSAGKTTTTTLVGEMLREEMRRGGDEERGRDDGMRSGNANTPHLLISLSPKVWVGGNIGNPLIGDVGEMRAQDKVVMELSSFQLELMTRSPHIACITNITPNHLDRHGTMDAYIAAKKHIVDFQTSDDWQVLSADDAVTKTLNTQAQTAWFSISQEPQGAGAWMDEGGNLRLRQAALTPGPSPGGRGGVICHRRELLLMGDHNILNVLAAALVSALAGGSIEAIRQVATTFRGVAHRLQLVSDLNGARWYDDSIATAPERLMAALKCFSQPVILLCGGRDKNLPWDEAAQLMLARCKHIILFGEMREMVKEILNDECRMSNAVLRHSTFVTRHSLAEAVSEAKRVAGAGDVVLLSPGGTSYDAFKDFAERGDKFRGYVNG